MKQITVLFFVFPLFSFGQHFSTTTIEAKPLPAMPGKVEEIVEAIKSYPNYKSLSKEEAEWFYWTNYSRQRPIAFWDSVVTPVLIAYPNLVSKYSASLKKDLYRTGELPILIPNAKLINLAKDHANDLGTKKSSPSHSSTNGNTFQQRMLNSGIINCAGENISFGPADPILALVFLYIDEGLPDLGHRKSLLTPSYTQMGIGISAYPNNMFMIIQDFACAQTP